jgi:hypothetical protein
MFEIQWRPQRLFKRGPWVTLQGSFMTYEQAIAGAREFRCLGWGGPFQGIETRITCRGESLEDQP